MSAAAVRRTTGPRHLVRSGESLWSIAGGQLRDGATDEEIAAQVKRIWAVNADRIGTGDPDVLPTGTVLRLPPVPTP